MAHNAYIRVGGDWSLDNVVTSGEFATIDLRQFQAINGDLGGTWAPSSQIVVGGSGIRSTGPSRFDDVTYLEMHVGGEIVLADGGFLTVSDGAAIVCENNSTASIDMQSGSEMLVQSGATVTFDGATNWPLLTPDRVVTRDHLRLGGAVKENGSTLMDPSTEVAAVHPAMFAIGGSKVAGLISCARPDATTSSVEWIMAIEDPVDEATLSQVVIGSLGSSLLVVAPTYTVQRVHLGTLVVDNLSVTTADAHLVAGTFSPPLLTSISCTTNNVINRSLYKYQILCTTGTGTAPSHFWAWYSCSGGYAVSALRP